MSPEPFNPYRAPAGEREPGDGELDPLDEPISQLRYFANVGCGAVLLFYLLVLAGGAAYRVLMGEVWALTAVVMSGLLSVGVLHSMLWAARRRRPDPAPFARSWLKNSTRSGGR